MRFSSGPTRQEKKKTPNARQSIYQTLLKYIKETTVTTSPQCIRKDRTRSEGTWIYKHESMAVAVIQPSNNSRDKWNRIRPARSSIAYQLLFPVKQQVMQDIAQRQHALKHVVAVDDHESVHARAADRVKDRIETVLGRAGVNTGEVLLGGISLEKIEEKGERGGGLRQVSS